MAEAMEVAAMEVEMVAVAKAVCRDRGVPVHRDLVVWRPAGGAAATRTDELHGHTQRLRAGDLGALLRVGLAREVGRAAVGHVVALQRARVHKERALRMLVEAAAGRAWLRLAARRGLPLASAGWRRESREGNDRHEARHLRFVNYCVRRAALRFPGRSGYL